MIKVRKFGGKTSGQYQVQYQQWQRATFTFWWCEHKYLLSKALILSVLKWHHR